MLQLPPRDAVKNEGFEVIQGKTSLTELGFKIAKILSLLTKEAEKTRSQFRELRWFMMLAFQLERKCSFRENDLNGRLKVLTFA